MPGVAFQELYRSELPAVWRFLRRLGLQGKDLEDLTQEVFLTVHQRLATYDVARPLRPWVLGIAFRRAADFRRRAYHGREVAEGEAPDVEDARMDLERTVVQREARELVYGALEELPLERRAILVMHDLEGHSVPDIAEATGAPLATTYSRLRLARDQFARAVAELRARGSRT
jgi:RNA polymerase sigma-70 factor, ECF subfamily